MIRRVLLFACVGVAICPVLIGLWKIGEAVKLPPEVDSSLQGLFLVFWPPSLGLMALHGHHTRAEVLLVYAVLTIANGLLYAVVGLLLGVIGRLMFRPGRRARGR